MTNPLAPIAKLRDRVAAAVKARGLILTQFVVIPGGSPEGPHRVQVVLMVDEDFKPDAAVPTVDDPEFERVMREAEEAEREAEAQALKEKLTDLRENLQSDLQDPRGGIGLD